MKNNKQCIVLNRLKKYRRIMGYKQIEVMRFLGFKSTNRICRWEHGCAVPDMKNLLKLSILYKTLPNQLYPELLKELQKEIKQKWDDYYDNDK